MKLYTDKIQTDRLIELGFEKPEDDWFDMNYSIGELIEMLDNIPDNYWSFSRTSDQITKVEVNVFPKTKKDKHLYRIIYRKNLIDALYDMIVKLKEDGVI